MGIQLSWWEIATILCVRGEEPDYIYDVICRYCRRYHGAFGVYYSEFLAYYNRMMDGDVDDQYREEKRLRTALIK